MNLSFDLAPGTAVTSDGGGSVGPFIPPTITVANNGFTSPTTSAGSSLQLAAITTTPYSSTTVLPSWTVTAFQLSPATTYYGISDNDPSYITEDSAAYPCSLYLNFQACTGTMAITQAVTIPQAGTYQLSFAVRPWSITYYSSTQSISATFGGQALKSVSFTAGGAWTIKTLSAAIGAAGSYPISIITSCSTAFTPATVIWLTDVEVTWVSA